MSILMGTSFSARASFPLGALLLALSLPGPGLGQSPAGKAQGDRGGVAPRKEVPSTPILRALSMEVESLKRSIDYQLGMWLYTEKGRTFQPGIHLGRGLIAAPFSESLKPGDCGFAYFKEGKYRVLHIGSDKPFVSFFRLPDPLALDRLPIPKLPRAPSKGERPGNLVVLLGPMGETKLSFLPHFPRFGMSSRLRRGAGRGSSRDRERRHRSPYGFFGFILPGESVVGGSVALNPKGEFLGMAVQGPGRREGWAARPSRNRPKGRKASSRPLGGSGGKRPGGPNPRKPGFHVPSQRAPRGAGRSMGWGRYSVVLSQRLLIGRAERWSKKNKDLLPNRILLGVSLDWRGARKAQEEGVVVSDLFPGAPASRAGFKVGDRLLRFGSKVIRGRKDLLEAIAGHKVGETVPVLLSRGGKEFPVLLHLD